MLALDLKILTRHKTKEWSEMYISITNTIRAVVKNDNSRVILTEFEIWHHHLLAVTLHKSVNFLLLSFPHL